MSVSLSRRRWGQDLLRCFCLAIVIMGSEWCQAQTPLPDAIDIKQLLRILLEQSPRLAALESQVQIAEAGVTGAKVLPNPRINYGRYDLISGFTAAQFNGNQQQVSSVDIPLLIAGQREVRQRAAEQGVSAARAQAQLAAAELARRTWALFEQLLAAEARVRVLEDAQTHLQRVKNIVVGRAASGAASAYEVLRLSVEEAGIAARLADRRSEVTSNGGEIGTLLGFPGWFPRADGQLKPIGVSVDLATLRTLAEQRNPAVEAARRAETAANAAVTGAKRERWPVPVVSLGSTWTNSPDSLTSFLGLSVEVPLFDRKQGSIAKAHAEQQTALLTLAATTAETRAEVERATRVLTERQASLRSFEANALGQLESLDRMAEDAYRLGQGGLVQLLDATRARTDLRLTHLDLQEAVTKAEVDTLAAGGLLLDYLDGSKK
jgi:outer membrane protein, heavy metal efflux system